MQKTMDVKDKGNIYIPQKEDIGKNEEIYENDKGSKKVIIDKKARKGSKKFLIYKLIGTKPKMIDEFMKELKKKNEYLEKKY